MANEVTVPRWALAVGIAVVFGLVAAVSFLLGRGTNMPARPTVAQGLATFPEQAAPAAGEQAGGRRVEPASFAADAPAQQQKTEPNVPPVRDSSEPQTSPTPSPTAPQRVDTTVPSEDAERTAVAEYFQRVELELATGKEFEDANRTAMEALKDMSGGGVREVRDSQKRVRERVSQISAPAPCAEHQRLLLASMDQGISMLDELQNNMSTGEFDKLGDIATKGRDIEKSARAVDAVAAELKKRYRIAS